jgi:predicted nucleic acid-binding protein
MSRYIDGIKQGSVILGLDEELITLAGRLNYQRKRIDRNWGMMDSFILAASLVYDLRILTKDKQFADLKNAQML